MTTIESKTYADGTTATGVAPLPDMSPAEQDVDAAENLRRSAAPPMVDAASEGAGETTAWNWEAEIHKVAKRHMNKRTQGYFMQGIRETLAQQPRVVGMRPEHACPYAAPPEGYALISIDTLKAWGKLDEVRAACVYPASPADMAVYDAIAEQYHKDAARVVNTLQRGTYLTDGEAEA